MSERLLKLLTDSKTGPAEKLRALAAHAQDEMKASYIEIRVDGVGEIRLGDRPASETPAPGAAERLTRPASAGVGDAGTWGAGGADPETPAPGARLTPEAEALTRPGEICRMTVGSETRPLGEIAVARGFAGDDPPDLTPFVRCAELIHRLQAGYVDGLTGLYNRRRLDMEIAKLNVSEGHVAVAMLDIDHFKRVNDTYGHDAGDAVLREFASRLIEDLPEDGFIARYGGEEFCIILQRADEESAAGILEQIRMSASIRPIVFKKTEIRITSSAGVSTGPGRRADDLLMQADRALYAAKEGGRDRLIRSSDMSRRGASGLFSRLTRVLDRPLGDLGWYGQRVIGMDLNRGALSAVDFFGGITRLAGDFPAVLSFVRAGRTTYWVSAESPGLQVSGQDIRACPMPHLRRVQYDARIRRLYLIERSGRALFWADLNLSALHEVYLPKLESGCRQRCITAILPLGRGILVLDALARQILVLDRATLSLRQNWALPPGGYEISFCYLPSLKLVMAGGAGGSVFLSLDGTVVEESDQPVISAYSHPLVGLVISTPSETVQVR